MQESISMQDACHNELSKYDLARHESPSTSVVRAPDRYTGGHGFDSRQGLRCFLCPTLVTN